MIAYIDESGKTGTEKFNNGWNFSDQPYFAYGTIVVQKELVTDIINEIEKQLSSLNKPIQGELKWSNKAAQFQYKKIIPIFLNTLNKYNSSIYFDIENKKFTIAKYITNFVVFSQYEEIKVGGIKELIIPKKVIASYLFDYLSDNTLWSFCSFFDNINNQKYTMEEQTKKLSEMAKFLRFNIEHKIIIEQIEKTIDTIESSLTHDSNLLKYHFPIPNFKRDGSIYNSISPQIDCFNNLVLRIEKEHSNISIIHDILVEKNQLENEIDVRNDLTGLNHTISFSDSKSEKFIQYIDYLTGYAKMITTKILLNDYNQQIYLTELIEKTSLFFTSSINEMYKIFVNYSNEAIELKNYYDNF
jgi:hypothetical protein